MFATYPITVVRLSAIALVLYVLLNLSSETIKVSTALQQSHYLLRDLVRYFLLLFASLGFLRLYQFAFFRLGNLGKWVLAIAVFTSLFGIAAYLSLAINLLIVPETSWQTSLIAFFEFLKAELSMQFQQFVGGKQSLSAWISNWITQLQFQFLPQASDFPTGRGWIKLYLLFKLLASILLKALIVLGCAMFLFVRPLSKQNLLIGLLIMLWILSPIFGSTLSQIWSWVFNLKAVNGEAVRSGVAIAFVSLIAVQMWIDADTLSPVKKKESTRKSTKKSTAKPKKKSPKSKKVVQKTSK